MRKTFFQTRYALLFLGALIILLLAALLVGQNFILQEIVLPLEYMLWLAGLALKAVPQYVFWAVLIGFTLVLILRSFVSGGSRPSGIPEKPIAQTRSERVSFWALQVRLLGRGGYSRLRFAEYFGKLIQDILTYTGQIDPEKYTRYEAVLEYDKLDVPPAIQKFLKLRLAPITEIYRPGFFRWFVALLHRWLNALAGRIKGERNRQHAKTPVDGELLVAIDYLEHELEVNEKYDGYR